MRGIRFLSLLAASLIVVAPIEAMAQVPTSDASVRDRSRPEYDPLGMRLGGFDLNATLDLGVVHTDNVFAAETNEQSDTVFQASPSARLASHWSRHALSFEAGATFSGHQDFSNEDVDTNYVGAMGRLDVGSRSAISARGRLAHQVESRGNPDGTSFGPPVEYDITDLNLSVEHRFNRFRLVGSVGRMEYDFDGAQAFRNETDDTVTGRVEAEITPRIGALLELQADQRDFDNTPSLSSDGRAYLAGITVNMTDLMRGEVLVGQFDRDYDSGDSVNGLAVNANLDWYVSRLTTLKFSASRDARESGASGVTPYVQSQFGARADHELRRNIILTGGGSIGRREYEVIDREDEFSYVDVGADYILNRRVALRGRVSHEQTDSSGVNRYRDYKTNAVSFGVTLRL